MIGTLPTTRQIIDAINTDPGATLVRMHGTETIVEPREIWLPSLCAWVHVNGTRVDFDAGRGTMMYANDDRADLCTACIDWQDRNDV